MLWCCHTLTEKLCSELPGNLAGRAAVLQCTSVLGYAILRAV